MVDTKPAGVRARLHAKLKLFREEVAKGFIEESYSVHGVSFSLRTPDDDAEVWADAFVKQGNLFSYASSRRSPRLACALTRFQGIPVNECFEKPEEMTDDAWKTLCNDPVQKRYWTWSQMLLLLSTDVPPPIIVEMYGKYEELIKKRDEALGAAAESSPNS